MRKLLGLALVGSALLASCGSAPPPPAYDAAGLWTVEFSRPGDSSADRWIAAVTMTNRPNAGNFTMTMVRANDSIGSRIMAGNTLKGTVYFPDFPSAPYKGEFKNDVYEGSRTDDAGPQVLKMTRQ